MRITGGRLTGLRLSSPRGRDIRPTSDRVREALFNILGQRLDGLRVLDLFAGSGILGLEAFSRGAEVVLFVDRSPHSHELVRKNLLACGAAERGTFLRRDLSKGLSAGFLIPHGPFDLAFLDPPYGFGDWPGILQFVAGGDFMNPGATLVVETAKKTVLPVSLGLLRAVDRRLYGDTKLTFYDIGDNAAHE